MSNTIIGSVFERKTTTPNAPSTPGSSSSGFRNGFPLAQHRSQGSSFGIGKAKGKSAFQRVREESRRNGNLGSQERLAEPPKIETGSKNQTSDFLRREPDRDAELPHKSSWRSQISSENEARVSSMTEEERERERQEIIERFGEDVGDILRRAREKRERLERESARRREGNGGDKDVGMDPVELTDEVVDNTNVNARKGVIPTSPLKSATSTAASTRTNSPTPSSRRLRFAELAPQNVHVYESAPPSPRRKVLALPPPEEGDVGVVKLADFGIKLKMVYPEKGEEQERPQGDSPKSSPESMPQVEQKKDAVVHDVSTEEKNGEEPEEGTAEYIQRKYFPSQPRPQDVPELAWMTEGSALKSSASTSTMNGFPSPSHPLQDMASVAGSFDKDKDSPLSQLRFTLHGTPIPPSLSLKLPTHLGLHHHAEGTHAGYTLDDVFLLSRSTVKMQRSAMLGVLTGIVQVIRGRGSKRLTTGSETGSKPKQQTEEERDVSISKPQSKSSSTSSSHLVDLENYDYERDEEIRPALQALRSSPTASQIVKRILFTGLEACVEKGVVGVRGIEIVAEVLTSFNDSIFDDAEEDFDEESVAFEDLALDVGSVELSHSSEMQDTLVEALPLNQVLPQLVGVLVDPPDRAADGDVAGNSTMASTSTSTPTQKRILSILHTLASHSNQVSEELCKTTGLIGGVLKVFVTTSATTSTTVSISEIQPTTNPDIGLHIPVLRFFTNLALASRANAKILVDTGVPDVLMRFIFTSSSLFTTSTTSSSSSSLSPSSTPSSATAPASSSPPTSSPSISALSTSLPTLSEIIRFYATLGRYGMYTHIAADAKEVWWGIGQWVEGFVKQADLYHTSEVRTQTHNSAFSSSSLSFSLSFWHFLKTFSSLIEVWLVAATDPHRTTPEHALVWSQMEGLGWGMWVCGVLKNRSFDGSSFDEKNHIDVHMHVLDAFGALYRALGAWVEGAKINGVKGGEQVRLSALEVVQTSLLVDVSGKELKEQMDDIRRLGREKTGAGMGKSRMVKLARYSWVLGSIIRVLVGIGVAPGSGPGPGSASLSSGQAHLLKEICNGLVGLLAPTSSLDLSVCAFVIASRPLTSFLLWYLRLLKGTAIVSADINSWLPYALAILPVLQNGDEDGGMEVLKAVIRAVDEKDRAVGRHGSDVGADLELIRPFYEYEIRGKGIVTRVQTPKNRETAEDEEEDVDEDVVEETRLTGPLSPTPKSILMSTTQRLPPPSTRAWASSDSEESSVNKKRNAREWGPSGLPLGQSWVFRPVDHLLKSGNPNSLFKNIHVVAASRPEGWNPGEVEVVRAMLRLAVVGREVLQELTVGMGMTMEEAVFGCMKIFMLENEQDMEAHQEGMGEEVFRDGLVEKLMGELLRPYTISERMRTRMAPSHSGAASTLEEISLPFLGASNTPFYQFYTDLVGLYDAISFSHPLFGKVLLPPTSMRYPVDYRRLLWCDYPHVLRSLRVPVEQMIVGGREGVQEWLWPLEKDTRVLEAYVGTLVRYGGALEGFVRWIALHHVAGNIWEDLSEHKFTESQRDRARKLLKTVVQQGTRNVVQEVLTYRQVVSSVLFPPACFTTAGKWRESRREFIANLDVGGENLIRLLDN